MKWFLCVVVTLCATLPSINSAKDYCYVSQSGCSYKVTVSPQGGCNYLGDEPRNPRSKNSDVNALQSPEVDAKLSLKKMDDLEQTLTKMMEDLSVRSLRHIRQIRTDLRQMSHKMSTLKVKGISKRGGVLQQCPPEFVSVGTWPSCYRFTMFNSSWSEAKEYCDAFGADLLSLESIKEAYILDYLIKSNPEYQETSGIWTSGNYVVRNHKWMWTGKHQLRPISFSRWSPGEPNARSTNHCMILYKGDKYRWHDAMCTDKYPFVCEFEM